jgi:hypothetical protein
MQRSTRAVVASCLLVLLGGGCGNADRDVRPCSDLVSAYRTKGRALMGDVDGDGRADRVTLRVNAMRPPSCRHVLVVALRGGIATAPVRPLVWPGTNPQLLLLAEIDGRPGVEPVVAMSPANVYRPGAVFAARGGTLSRMRLETDASPELFPLDDEFPAGVDCAGDPGTIVVTHGNLERGGDRYWEIRRTVYRASGSLFRPLASGRFRLEVGPEAARRWPELDGRPFRSCGGLRR